MVTLQQSGLAKNLEPNIKLTLCLRCVTKHVNRANLVWSVVVVNDSGICLKHSLLGVALKR